MSRFCKHGNYKGKCGYCECDSNVAALEKEIAALNQKLSTAKDKIMAAMMRLIEEQPTEQIGEAYRLLREVLDLINGEGK